MDAPLYAMSDSIHAKNAQVGDNLLDKEQAAELLNIKPRTLDKWLKRRLIPYYKIGKAVRFCPRAIREHLESTCRVGNAR